MNKTKFYILYSKFSRSRGGYIALTSAVIIVMIIISIISALSLASYFSRSNILTSEFKDLSLGLAEGCAEKALLKYSQDSSYIGNENILIGGRQCSILPIETSGSNKIIKTEATVESVTSNIKVTVNSADLTLISWEELASF
ncbi:MAG: hypothetical protein A3E61_02230 [Candidatus Colwellbacteria bacterium RIFCSPHIGHO2_12_FULL_43_12]|uniref:Type 4 fimbrial biogenesis protein PilX N-terminal domain-containing protein n=1 Tax=Candidatus Colwellbacteria bacterium RIFCSPHIGHO2_12_FULL_43_12 TaxID=1797688 RepID=A0A1G1Z2W7_9BACT|nr:MAG: hypothetical protein A3E61_02230 [Candidatus Colwellbacteria bacterium RIFCSPHIGHO2_12_FULL_43_12]